MAGEARSTLTASTPTDTTAIERIKQWETVVVSRMTARLRNVYAVSANPRDRREICPHAGLSRACPARQNVPLASRIGAPVGQDDALGDAVEAVEEEVAGERLEVSMSEAASMAFLAWLEAAPPGGHLVA